EVNFLNYTQIPDGKGWIEQEVEFRLNDKVYMREKYFNIIPEKDFYRRNLIRRLDRAYFDLSKTESYTQDTATNK
ncbi:MAG: hypothetical protein LBS69_09170, partial [Prevotellaceae bacterium]|nr:hypothetical protein [Prevotellaceae bacterium]